MILSFMFTPQIIEHWFNFSEYIIEFPNPIQMLFTIVLFYLFTRWFESKDKKTISNVVK